MCYLKARRQPKCQSEQVLISADVLLYIAICTMIFPLQTYHKLFPVNYLEYVADYPRTPLTAVQLDN